MGMPATVPDDPVTGRAPSLFDQRLREKRRARAVPTLARTAFLHEHAAAAIASRLDDIARTFPDALCLNACGGFVPRAVSPDKVTHWISLDPLPAMMREASMGVAARTELLPFDTPCFDLVVSFLDLHHLNDVPGALIQANRVLKPDGLFLGVTFGGATLHELRTSLMEAEIALTGGAAQRVAPMADIRDYGALLQRGGFALPVTDVDRLTARYHGLMPLLGDLRAMGETSIAVSGVRQPLSRSVLMRADEIFRARHADHDGRVRVTFEMVMLTGWAPHESQQKPLRPGSARQSLAAALGASERSAGEKPGS